MKKLAIVLAGTTGLVCAATKIKDVRMLKHERNLDENYLQETASMLKARALILGLTGQTDTEEFGKLREEAAFLKSVHAYHS